MPRFEYICYKLAWNWSIGPDWIYEFVQPTSEPLEKMVTLPMKDPGWQPASSLLVGAQHKREREREISRDPLQLNLKGWAGQTL